MAARRTTPDDLELLPSSADAIELRAVRNGHTDHDPSVDLPAEQQLLGHILNATVDPNSIDPDTFTDYRHQAIHAATRSAHTATGSTDPATVLHHLQAAHKLTAPTDHAGVYLFDLYDQAVGDPHYWRRIAREAADRRRLHTVLTRAQQQLAEAGDPAAVETALWDTLAALVDPATRAAHNPTGEHDLTWLLTGQPPVVSPPVHCRRRDGRALFYAGRVNGLYGEPETAKTWIAQHTAIEALMDGQRVAIIDVDHNGPELTTRNLLLLGARPGQLADRNLFRYLEPDDPTQLLAAVDTLAAWSPAVAVLDSVGEILPMLGVKSVDNDEITTALRRVATPLADAGACVITIDHLPKDGDAKSSGYAIGGTAKKRAIDGSYVEARAKKKPAPGQVGRITLHVSKDRPGGLREHCSGGTYAGQVTLDSTKPGTTTLTIDLDSPITAEGIFRPTHLMEAISVWLASNPWASTKGITDSIRGDDKAIRAALECLITEGYVKTEPGPRNATKHYLVATYTEAEDDRT